MHDVPLVVPIHSLEQDRAATVAPIRRYRGLEGAGVRAASRVIGVSTHRSQDQRVHGVRTEIPSFTTALRPAVVNAYREEPE